VPCGFARRHLPAHFPEGQTLRDCLRVSLVALASLLPLWLARRLGRLRRALALCAVLAVDLIAVGRGLLLTTPVASVDNAAGFSHAVGPAQRGRRSSFTWRLGLLASMSRSGSPDLPSRSSGGWP